MTEPAAATADDNIWPPLPPSGIGWGGSCGIIGTIASCCCGWGAQAYERVTTRRILRDLLGVYVTTRAGTLRLALVTATRLACLT